MAWNSGVSSSAWVGDSHSSKQHLVVVSDDTSVPALKSPPPFIILVPFNDGLALWCVLSGLGGRQLLVQVTFSCC